MLHVFLVDTGIMLKFEIELAVESVAHLMEAVHQRAFIPANKQVLISANGEPLSPTHRVASYASCGTETQPIYLFSKSTIESPVPPSPSINLGSVESLKGEVERSLKMKPKYDTLVARAKLAAEFQRIGVEIGENCENLVNDQFLQKDGWRAVVLNLDQITSAFEQHVNVFEDYFRSFLVAKLHYNQMILKHDHVLLLLKQLPLLSCLPGHQQHTSISLLQWISTHDKQSSIENLVRQCHEALQKCNEGSLEAIVRDAHRVLDSVNNEGMKEIKGLSERLVSLQERLRLTRQLIQDQTDMAQGFHQNQKRAEHIGDPSVLPDLCASHQKQLIVLLKNHHQIREIRNLCARAKDELSTNLHARLRWVMSIEKSIFECDSRLLVYHESLKRIKKRLDIFEQVFEAPKMYVLAVLEVMRRKNFSAQFIEWSKSVMESSINARTEELTKREMFHKVFGNHFIKNLFPGLDNKPLPFAEEAMTPCDDDLPDICVEDIKLLQQTAPDLMSELHIGDSLESSIIVRTCLSQSNLTKLVDPRQNKTLEETMAFREKALVDNQQLTMSVLKREISANDVGDFSFPENVGFQIGASSDDLDVTGGTAFEPGSLRSLSREKVLTTSSDSDALFHSAELDFSCSSPGIISPLSPSLASPSSAKSGSGKSSSGKSSSSPITIKSVVGQRRWRQSQSLSPESIPTVREEVFSLPNIEKNSQISLSIVDDKDSSQNSCRSLSEAIRSVEINKKLVQSSDIVLKASKEVHELKLQFCSSRDECFELTQNFCVELVEIKNTILDALQQKDGVLRQKDDEIERLQAIHEDLTRDKENAVSDYEDKIKELHQTIDEKQKQFDIFLVERDVVLEKIKLESTNDIQVLQTERDSLSESLNKCEYQIRELDKQIEDLKHENRNLNEIVGENQTKVEMYESRSTANDKLESDYLKKLDQLQQELEKAQRDRTEFEECRETLATELGVLKSQLGTLQEENAALKKELEELSISTQESIDEHLSHVSSVTTQHKELKRKLAEKEQELSQALMVKDSLEAQKQSNFNVVFNKIKKEKDAQIKDMALQISFLEKELQTQRSRGNSLNNEINVHKEAYSRLEEDFKKVQNVNRDLENQLESCSLRSMEEQNSLKQNLEEMTQNVESLKQEKLRVMQELKTQYDEELRKEKASLLLTCELEKESAIEIGKSENATKMSMSTSIEEGIDMLEIDQLLEKVRNLETENEKLKETISIKEKKEKELAISASPKAQKVVRTSEVKPVEKIALRDLNVGSLVFLCYDDTTHHYMAMTSSNDKYFLHPDSAKHIQTGKGAEKRQWLFAYITDKELCIAKKANNKFNLPINTYFSRIHVKAYDGSR